MSASRVAFYHLIAVFSSLIFGVHSQASESYFWVVDNGCLFRIDVERGQMKMIGDTGFPRTAEYGGLGYHRQSNRLLAILGEGRGGAGSTLVELDRNTGRATPIATIPAHGPNDFYGGFDISPSGEAYVHSAGQLLMVDLDTGALSPKFALTSAIGYTDLAFDDTGRLWEGGSVGPLGSSVLSQIDMSDGSVTIRHTVPGIDADSALGFNPDDGYLYWTNDDGPLKRMDPDGGQVQLVEIPGVGDFSEVMGTFAPVPEPAGTYAILAAGLGMIGAIRRRY